VIQLPGAFPIFPMRASATLDHENSRSPEWQVAFLGKTEPRAARPEDVPDEGYE
jgi:hypothetical protein